MVDSPTPPKPAEDRTREARELLAAEYDRVGLCVGAKVLRSGSRLLVEDKAALRAITAALTTSPAVAEAVDWQGIETAPENAAIQIHVPTLDYYGNNGVYAGMLVNMGTGRRWMTFGWAIGRDLGPENAPDAWRPLPDAPALSSLKGGR